MSLAVVGTGTEVGKTIVSAVLCARYGADRPVPYWKPVATGSVEGRDTETVARLAGDRAVVLPETYLFPEPLSPHLAARLVGAEVEVDRLVAEHFRLAESGRPLLVEGVGGLLVPLNEESLLADLLQAIELPAVVVALAGLGTINHTLLTLEAMRRRGLAVAAVVFNGPENRDNREAVAAYGEVATLALSPLEPLDRDAVYRAAEAFDRDGLLAPHLLQG